MPLAVPKKRAVKRALSKKSITSSIGISSDWQCRVTTEIYNALNCGSSNPMIPQICDALKPIYDRCNPTPTDPCDGVSCPTGQICQDGACITQCSPSGSPCATDGSCCSGVCSDNMCQ